MQKYYIFPVIIGCVMYLYTVAKESEVAVL